MTEPAVALEHWPALDGLRGVAVAGVVVFHIRPEWLPGGFLGVDLFFALSGFLITSLLLRDASTHGRVRLRAFWGRRFRRLIPAVMLVIASVLAWTAVWGTPAEQAASRGDAAWAVPYLANWHLIDAARDYWASATADSPFTHLWSLAIEEQFYVVWPLLVWLLLRGRSGERGLLVVTATLAIASATALGLLFDPDQSTRAYMGTDTRAFALLFGALFALAPVRSRVRAVLGAWAGVLTPALFGALGLIWWYGGDHLDWLLGGGLIAHSFLAALLVCLLANAGRGLLASAPLVWLGRLSYGVYLWHFPVIRLGRPRLVDLPGAVQDVLLVALSVLLAAVSFHLVEHPIRRQLGWARGRRAAWATLAAAGVATSAIVLSPTGRGHVAAFDVASVTTSSTASTSTSTTSSTTSTTTAADVIVTAVDTTIVAATSTTSTSTSTTSTTLPRRTVGRVLWIGDSVAADEAPAVVAALTAAGVTPINGAFEARRIISSDGVVAEELYPPILSEAAADVVVVQLTTWDSPHQIEVQRAAFSWFAALVLDSGADLVFVTPPPIRADLEDPGLARQIQVIDELIAGDAGLHLIDSSAAWGDELDVDIGDDGAPDRKPDGVHVCPQGAARFATWLIDELATRFRGITPASPEQWVAGDWTSDVHYDTPVGACAALAGN